MNDSMNSFMKNNVILDVILNEENIRVYLFRSNRFCIYRTKKQEALYGTYSFEPNLKLFNLRTFYSEYYKIEILSDNKLKLTAKQKKWNFEEKVWNDVSYTKTTFNDVDYEDNFIKIEDNVIKGYYKNTYGNRPKIYPCLAPLSNLNFSSEGNMGLCNVNSEYIFGKWPDTSIKNAWFGEKRIKAAKAVIDGELDMTCVCHTFLNNIFTIGAVPMDGYDNAYDLYDDVEDIENNYPANVRFQLGITCNMKCVMCGEYASSLHRKDKGLPVYKSPFELYPNKFMNELDEFLPHLKKIVYTGGESFLQPLYYKIWNRLMEINWKGRQYIFSNGSIYNSQIHKILEFFGKNLQLNLSIDSFDEKIYKRIRVNGNYEKMLENLLINYKKTGCDIRLSVTAMKENAWDMTNIVKFCDENYVRAGIYPVFTNHSYYDGDKVKSQAVFDWDISYLKTLLKHYYEFRDSYWSLDDVSDDKIYKENKKYFLRYLKDIENYIKYQEKRNNGEINTNDVIM